MNWNRRNRSGTPVTGPSSRSEARVKAEWYGELVRRCKIQLDTQVSRIEGALVYRTQDTAYLRQLLRTLHDESLELRRELDKPMG